MCNVRYFNCLFNLHSSCLPGLGSETHEFVFEMLLRCWGWIITSFVIILILIIKNVICFVSLPARPLTDSFLPRSSRRPSSFLLQDAYSSSVLRSLHLQAPAAAPLVPPCSWPQHSQKYKRQFKKEKETKMKSSLSARLQTLLYRFITDSSTCEDVEARRRRFWQWPPHCPPLWRTELLC